MAGWCRMYADSGTQTENHLFLWLRPKVTGNVIWVSVEDTAGHQSATGGMETEAVALQHLDPDGWCWTFHS